MKKRQVLYLALVIITGVLISLLTACGSKMPCLSFPLDESAVSKAIEESGLEGSLSPEETIQAPEGVVYVVRSETETYTDESYPEHDMEDPKLKVLVASISTGMIENERVIYNVFDQIDIPEEFSWDIWKKQIILTTKLYGGFRNEEVLYEALIEQPLPGIGEPMGWDVELSGGYCRVSFMERESDSHDEKMFLVKRYHGALIVSIYPSKEFFFNLYGGE